MDIVLIIIISVLVVLNSISLFVIVKKNKTTITIDNDENFKNLSLELNKLQNVLSLYNSTITEVLKTNNDLTISNLNNIGSNQLERLENLNKRLEVLTNNLENKFDKTP